MEQTVYIDLYFMINFAMDFLCFYLTSWLLSLHRSLLRTMLASAFGALYACVALLIGLRGIWSILADLAICLLMCAIAYYRPKEARAVAVDALVYSAVSILLGGAMTALFYFFNRMGLDRFAQVLEEGFEAYEISAIPATVDQVLMGSVSKTRLKNVRALFILGANEGCFPMNQSDDGMINDSELDKLCALGLNRWDGAKERSSSALMNV